MKNTKYGLMMIWVFLLGFITWVLNSIEISYLIDKDEGFTVPENFIDQAFSVVGTWWRMITFQVYGVPSVVQTILGFAFYAPLTTFIAMLVVNWIRGTE